MAGIPFWISRTLDLQNPGTPSNSHGGDDLIVPPPDDSDGAVVAGGMLGNAQVEVSQDSRLNQRGDKSGHAGQRQWQHVVERRVKD